jgi:hypothetical protein
MTHIALADGALFWLLAVMTLLLVMFIGAIIVAPPARPAPTHARAPEPPAPEPPAPDWGLPARQPQAPAFPAGGPAAHAGSVVTHATAPAPSPPPPKPSSEPPPRLPRAVGIAGLALAGVALTVIGGMLFRRPVQGGLACSHHTGAICLQGTVLLTGTQVAGVVTALAGIALFFAAVFLAVR